MQPMNITTLLVSPPDPKAGGYSFRPLPAAFLAPEPDQWESYHWQYTHDMPAAPAPRAGEPCVKSAAMQSDLYSVQTRITFLRAHTSRICMCRQLSQPSSPSPVHAWQRLHLFAVTDHAVHFCLQLRQWLQTSSVDRDHERTL